MDKKTRIAVIGGGLGGATMGALLQRAGYGAVVFEQAPHFAPVGAGIHISPNPMKVMRQLNLERRLLASGCRPKCFMSRCGNTGDVLFDYPLGTASDSRFGSPYLTINRGEFHRALVDALLPGSIQYGCKLIDVVRHADGVEAIFENGRRSKVDVLVGADGISSSLRRLLQGAERPSFSGVAAFRSTIASDRLLARPSHELTKWWAADRFVVAYYLDASKKTFYFVAGVPCDAWEETRNSVPATTKEVLEQFSGFHPEVQAVLESSHEVRKWPIFERPPRTVWFDDGIVLLGDACHPMQPHMAQGAAMAIEDAAVLVRCLEKYDGYQWQRAFAAYARTRMARTNMVQETSAFNNWLREPTDPSWVYSYDPCQTELAEEADVK